MTQFANLTSQFLIAMPGLRDPNFARTVTYICEHTEKGAMGIVVNRPLDLSLGDVLAHMNIQGAAPEVEAQPVYLGGPVDNERGFVLHTKTTPWSSTLKVTTGIYITTSRDILEAMARGEGPERTLVALGYAGWASGQLESELQDNAWLSGPSDIRVLFDLPAEERWAAAARLLGVDLTLLSADAGHA
ncbi:MAG: YqgE/AlgH family protein [Gammaproteobacteria bacterium]|jgi:putative transcriptional regulator|nr:YqgE/AlgH family protein [Gammaproteobacteria bacterium]